MKIPFKVATIEEYKMCMNMDENLLKFIEDNFELSAFNVKPLNNNFLMVTDQKGESLVFTINDEQQVISFDSEKLDEMMNPVWTDEHDLEPI